jgi:hypothetical protein
MDNFILKFIHIKKHQINSEQLYKNAITYSKYYLYWKIYQCVYSESIMELLYDIENSNILHHY